MIVPAGIADAVRRLVGSRGVSGIVPLMARSLVSTELPSGQVGTRSGTAGFGGGGGAGTIVIKIGEEVIDEIVDRRLYVRESIYRDVQQTSSSLR